MPLTVNIKRNRTEAQVSGPFGGLGKRSQNLHEKCPQNRSENGPRICTRNVPKTVWKRVVFRLFIALEARIMWQGANYFKAKALAARRLSFAPALYTFMSAVVNVVKNTMMKSYVSHRPAPHTTLTLHPPLFYSYSSFGLIYERHSKEHNNNIKYYNII